MEKGGAVLQKGGRVFILDWLRGLAVLNMLLFHILYDIVYIFGVPIGWYTGLPGYLWQQTISWCFIIVSGASIHYGSRPFRRGAVILGSGLLISAVTFLFMPQERVLFGILHFIGTAMLLAALCLPLLKRIPPWIGVFTSTVLFLFLKGVPRGFVGFADYPFIQLPAQWYQFSFLFPLGFPAADFWSSDYFAVIPWFFLYLAGYFAWALLKPHFTLQQRKPRPVEWVGQKSLWFYLAHQPVMYAILWVFFTLLRR